MQRFYFCAILLLAIGIGKIICHESENLKCKTADGPAPVSKRLREHLFCEYDSFVRPTLNDHTPTLIEVRMVPQSVDFSEEANILNFHTWVFLTWPDMHLTWEPSKWENLEELRVMSYRIWKPDLSVFNVGEFRSSGDLPFVECLVTFNGTVKCELPMIFSSHCPTDYNEWPYDKHNCTVLIGAWLLYHKETLFKFEDDAIMAHAMAPNNQWDIHIERRTPEYFAITTVDGGDLVMIIDILLQRRASRLATIYILPAFIFMVLTLIVLWLDSQSSERMLVACVNFICHIFELFDLHWYFPNNGSDKTPKILVFYEISIGLAAMALILTCLLRKLRATSVSAPQWLTSITTLILNSPIGGLLTLNFSERKKDTAILEDSESNGQIAANTKDRTWQDSATIIECLSFVTSFLIYLITLAIVSIPTEPEHSDSFWLS